MSCTTNLFAEVFIEPLSPQLPLQPPHLTQRLRIMTKLPGIRSKRHMPCQALLQEVQAAVDKGLSDRLTKCTDGSVINNGEATAAACIAPEIGTQKLCHLPYIVSTMAEIAVIHLAADLLSDVLQISCAANIANSNSTLQALQSLEKEWPGC